MALLGNAAMALWFDIDDAAVDEHDHWHTHEHFFERLSIPGFLRGTRWAGATGGPRYFVMYEVRDIGVLTSGPYLARLNAPTPWTTKVMPAYRGMTRGLCGVVASAGAGTARAVLTLRFAPAADAAGAAADWMSASLLPTLAETPGIAGAHLLAAAAAAPMTAEQRIRGRDQAVDHVLVVTAYDEAALHEAAASELAPARLAGRGVAEGAQLQFCGMATSLSAGEVDAAPRAPA